MTALFRVVLDKAVNKIEDVRSFSLAIVMLDLSGHCSVEKSGHNRTDKTARDNSGEVITVKDSCFGRWEEKLKEVEG